MRTALQALSLILALAAVPLAQQPAAPVRRMVVTIDDLPYARRGPGDYLPAARHGTAAILAALKKHGVPAVGFVNEDKLEAPTAEERAARVALLEQWVAAVGHTGDTAEKKAGIAQGLASGGDTIAPHTIENSDYLYDVAYVRAGPAQRARLAENYLAHSMAVTEFAEQKARELFGRDDVPQTLLIHTMASNADHLEVLLDRLVARGYRFMTLEAAMRDPAYATPDAYVGARGPTWLFRRSRTIAPASSLRGDPEVPAWVMALFQAAQRG